MGDKGVIDGVIFYTFLIMYMEEYYKNLINVIKGKMNCSGCRNKDIWIIVLRIIEEEYKKLGGNV